MTRKFTLTLVIFAACVGGQPDTGLNESDVACALSGSPTVVKQNGNAVLQFWQWADVSLLSTKTLPTDAAYGEYRRVITQANADVQRPVADQPQANNDDEREIWRREHQNTDVAFSGRGGRIRAVQCLDAALFAYQNARYSQLTHPTEFVAAILRRPAHDAESLKVYFAASDEMFPPQDFYGVEQIQEDVNHGWELWTVLHNHTIQQNNGAPALGVPAPSTSDVDLLVSLASSLDLQNAWVTNGFYTIEIPAAAFKEYVGR